PFVMEVATFAPHRPYTPAPRNAHDYRGLKAPRNRAFDRNNFDPPLWLGIRPPLTQKQIHSINRAFRKRAQSAESVDRMIGRLEATPRALPLEDGGADRAPGTRYLRERSRSREREALRQSDDLPRDPAGRRPVR